MFIVEATQESINIEHPYTALDGTHGVDLRVSENRVRYGIVEIADPVPPADYTAETYFRNERRFPPYIVWERKSDEQIMAVMLRKYEGALDVHLDAVARDARYDNRFTMALRAGYAGPFQAEGQAFAQWMDICNAQAYRLLQDVLSGVVPAPALDDFIAGLPVFVKP